jgi:hypothetical protein
VLADQIGGALGNHHYSGIGVTADEIGYDRGIDDAKSLDAMHTQARIDHGLNAATATRP